MGKQTRVDKWAKSHPWPSRLVGWKREVAEAYRLKKIMEDAYSRWWAKGGLSPWTNRRDIY